MSSMNSNLPHVNTSDDDKQLSADVVGGGNIFSNIGIPSMFPHIPDSLSSLCTLASQLSQRINWDTELSANINTLHGSPKAQQGASALDLLTAISTIQSTTTCEHHESKESSSSVFVPRSFKGIQRQLSPMVIIDDNDSDDKSDDQIRTETNLTETDAITKKQVVQGRSSSSGIESNAHNDHSTRSQTSQSLLPLLRPVFQSIFERLFDEFLCESNRHNTEAMLTNFMYATRPDVITCIKYWKREDLFHLSPHLQASLPTFSATHSNWPSLNPFGFQDYLEISGLNIDGLRSLTNTLFAMVPDSVLYQKSEVKILDELNGVKRAVCRMSMVGTAILPTNTKDLHQCMPFITVAHPALHNPVSNQPTWTGSLVTGLTSLLSNIPISITMDVGLEVDGYMMLYMDVSSNKVFRLEFHYFRTAANPFPATTPPTTTTGLPPAPTNRSGMTVPTAKRKRSSDGRSRKK